jgi:hypothetical protein
VVSWEVNADLEKSFFIIFDFSFDDPIQAKRENNMAVASASPPAVLVGQR